MHWKSEENVLKRQSPPEAIPKMINLPIVDHVNDLPQGWTRTQNVSGYFVSPNGNQFRTLKQVEQTEITKELISGIISELRQ